jgi:predicted P-loop ATPase
VGKSTFWKLLAGEEWFDDTVGSTSDKDERLKLHQSWFIEWAELEAVFKRKDISAVKAFITTQTDQVRPPYGRTVQEFKRPSIIVGSTNETEFLADATGNRRYWVIQVDLPVQLQQLAVERDRIWGAVVHAFRSGERWELPMEMRQAAQEDAANYVSSDPWQKPVLEYANTFTKITTTEILANVLNLEYHQQGKREEMRVANLLRVNGWRSAREVVHGQRARIWLNPKFDDLGCPGCPNEAESLIGVEGQPNGQPPGQPPGQPTENGFEDTEANRTFSKRDNLDNDPHQIPKSGRTLKGAQCQDRETSIELPPVGAKVEIKKGRYDGVAAWVVAHVDDKVSVKRDGWTITREYSVSEVKVLRDD